MLPLGKSDGGGLLVGAVRIRRSITGGFMQAIHQGSLPRLHSAGAARKPLATYDLPNPGPAYRKSDRAAGAHTALISLLSSPLVLHADPAVAQLSALNPDYAMLITDPDRGRWSRRYLMSSIPAWADPSSLNTGV